MLTINEVIPSLSLFQWGKGDQANEQGFDQQVSEWISELMKHHERARFFEPGPLYYYIGEANYQTASFQCLLGLEKENQEWKAYWQYEPGGQPEVERRDSQRISIQELPKLRQQFHLLMESFAA